MLETVGHDLLENWLCCLDIGRVEQAVVHGLFSFGLPRKQPYSTVYAEIMVAPKAHTLPGAVSDPLLAVNNRPPGK